jgi:hypothetical protein
LSTRFLAPVKVRFRTESELRAAADINFSRSSLRQDEQAGGGVEESTRKSKRVPHCLH